MEFYDFGNLKNHHDMGCYRNKWNYIDMRNWASDSDTKFHVCLISFENVDMIGDLACFGAAGNSKPI